MMKNRVIRHIVANLLAFAVCFIIEILFTYFSGNDLNVWDAFIDACFTYIVFFAVDFFLDRKKAKKANNKKEKTE